VCSAQGLKAYLSLEGAVQEGGTVRAEVDRAFQHRQWHVGQPDAANGHQIGQLQVTAPNPDAWLGPRTAVARQGQLDDRGAAFDQAVPPGGGEPAHRRPWRRPQRRGAHPGPVGEGVVGGPEENPLHPHPPTLRDHPRRRGRTPIFPVLIAGRGAHERTRLKRTRLRRRPKTTIMRGACVPSGLLMAVCRCRRAGAGLGWWGSRRSHAGESRPLPAERAPKEQPLPGTSQASGPRGRDASGKSGVCRSPTGKTRVTGRISQAPLGAQDRGGGQAARPCPDPEAT
jgi:hypothetical protein